VCRRSHTSYIVHLHGSRFRQFWDGSPPWFDRALVRLFSGAACTIVLGTVWAEYVATRAPAAASRIAIFPSASRDAAREYSGSKAGPAQILFSGRHGACKGVRQLTTALGKGSHESSWRATR